MKTAFVFGPEHAYYELRSHGNVVTRSKTMKILHSAEDMKTWLYLMSRLDRRCIALAVVDDIKFRRIVRNAYVKLICEIYGTDVFYPGPRPEHIATKPWNIAKHGEWNVVPRAVARKLIKLKEKA